MQFTSSPFHLSPQQQQQLQQQQQQQQQQQRKRPHMGDHSQSGVSHSPYRQNHISNLPHSNYYVFGHTSVQQQPMAFIPYFQSPTEHNKTQAMIPIQVQSQFQPTPTFSPLTPILRRDHSDSTLASVEQPLHLLPSLPSSGHQPVTVSATLNKLTKEAAAKANYTRKKNVWSRVRDPHWECPYCVR